MLRLPNQPILTRQMAEMIAESFGNATSCRWKSVEALQTVYSLANCYGHLHRPFVSGRPLAVPGTTNQLLSPASYKHVLSYSGSVVGISWASALPFLPRQPYFSFSYLILPLSPTLTLFGNISDPPAILAGKNPSRSAFRVHTLILI